MDRLPGARILQINLGHCRAAQDLMYQMLREKRADAVIVSEPWKASGDGWYADATGRAAVYVPPGGKRVTSSCTDTGRGWVWIEIGTVKIYSCYFSPSSTMQQYKDDIADLESELRGATGPLIVAGDFNAKAADWGSSITDARGTVLSLTASSLRLHVAN